MKKHATVDSQSNEIDLTPMLDVVFIMLIFFIVTASFLNERSLPVRQSPDTKSDSPPTHPMVISVSSSDEITIDNRAVSINAIRALISQKQAETPDTPVIVNAHEQASANSYVAIIDAINQARVEDFTLKTHE